MHIDQAEEWRRLTEHYRTLYDEELLNLAIEPGDLTEIAQQILRDEMRTRGLDNPIGKDTVRVPQIRNADSKSQEALPPGAWENAIALSDQEEETGEEEAPHTYTWKTPLCDCASREEAWQIREVLRRAGIDSWIEAPSYGALDLNGPRVVVAADQLEQARAIASRPIPQDIIDDSKIELPEFETPHCPTCGSADPLLMSVEPVNTWQCELCGKEWTDSTRYVTEERD